MSFYNLPKPWNPGYAIPEYVNAEPPGRGTFTTAWLPRGTISAVVPDIVVDDPGRKLRARRESPGRKLLGRRAADLRGSLGGDDSLSGHTLSGHTLGCHTLSHHSLGFSESDVISTMESAATAASAMLPAAKAQAAAAAKARKQRDMMVGLGVGVGAIGLIYMLTKRKR